MSKYIDAEKLTKFEETLADIIVSSQGLCTYEACKDVAKSEAPFLIASLQQEQPNKYETALEKARKWMPNVNQGGHAILIDIFPELGEGLDPRYGGRKQEQPEVELEKFTEKIKTFQGRYKYPESISIKGAMAFMARMFYQYPNVARLWYEQLPKATMDNERKEK